MQQTRTPPPLGPGSLVNDRYEIRQSLGKGGMGEVFLAYDRSTQEPVALKVVREESRMPGDDEALRQELLLARSISHPNVCRVHDLAPSPWGPILVMEHINGQTLHTHIRRRKAQGGYTADEFRKIASEVTAGLAAIHAQGLVHGDLKPGNVMVTKDRAIILDFGFAQERARLGARRPGAPPDGGTPNYMAPERLKSGGASPEDDIYALGLTLWEMWTCRVPEPGYKPRAKPMRTQIMFDVPASLSVDEVKQVFRCLADDPEMRPEARRMRFFNPVQLTTSQLQIPKERIAPGAPLGRSYTETFHPGAQALLVTFCTNATDAPGLLIPLNQPTVTVGRRADQDVVLPEATVSGHHAVMRWQAGTWLVEDVGSTNGSFADHSYERKKRLSLLHGAEAQLGECRVKLVSFANGSAQHERAKLYLARHDGLTGLLQREPFLRALAEEVAFAKWTGSSVSLARYKIRGPTRSDSERPTILEMLALRRVATRIVELTEMMMIAMIPAVAGRTGHLKFAIGMMGPGIDEARAIVEQVVAQVQGLMPDTLDLDASVVRGDPEHPVEQLLDF
ncbi:MAG: protein kinase [Sorangiineae bacterium NIC37A_2]|jgi:GGDEF domain-containing protein|nr:MAG: protein kinase [Sorangiineae bacterium NIC37A_2]